MSDRTEQIYRLLCRNERTTVREITAALGLSSTSIALYHLRKLRRQGRIDWPDRQSRDYRVLDRPDPAARVTELESALRLMRRWIENEDRPGEWTAEIYELAGKLLPY